MTLQRLTKILTSGALLLAISSFLSRGLGVYRDHLFAKIFGVSPELDAYYAAFAIPDLLYALLIMSSISAVFLPMFQKLKIQNNWKESWRFTSAVMNTLFLVFLVLGGLFIIFAPYFVSLYVPEFSGEQKELTSNLMRIMMLSPLFFLFSSVMITVENAFHTFFAQALAPILYNLGIIAGAFFLVPTFGISGIAYGVILGAFLQMLIQIPFFLQTGFQWKATLLKGKELKEFSIHFWPRLLSVSISNLTQTANIMIAATIGTGAITLYNFAFNIQSFTFGLIAVSLSIPAFSKLTHAAAEKNDKDFQKILQSSFEKILFWMIPANIGLFFIAEPLVKILLEYGKFTHEDTNILALLIQIFAIGLMLTGGNILLTKAFLAKQKTWTIAIINLLSLVLNIFLVFFLSKVLGLSGLITGMVIATLITTLILGIISFKDFGILFSWKELGKIVIAAGIMTMALWMLSQKITSLLPVLQLFTLTGAGSIIFLGMAYFLNTRSLKI